MNCQISFNEKMGFFRYFKMFYRSPKGILVIPQSASASVKFLIPQCSDEQMQEPSPGPMCAVGIGHRLPKLDLKNPYRKSRRPMENRLFIIRGLGSHCCKFYYLQKDRESIPARFGYKPTPFYFSKHLKKTILMFL